MDFLSSASIVWNYIVFIGLVIGGLTALVQLFRRKTADALYRNKYYFAILVLCIVLLSTRDFFS